MVKCGKCEKEFKDRRGMRWHKCENPVESLDSPAGTKAAEFSDVDAVMAEAETRAEENGHILGPWKRNAGWSVASCVKCRGEITAAPFPAQGKLRVDGVCARGRCA